MPNVHRIPLVFATLFAIAFTASACASNDASATNGTDIHDSGKTDSAAVSPTEACTAYVRCTSNTSPADLGVIVDAYGDHGSCWQQNDTSVCSQGCLLGLRQARAAVPDEPTCKTCFSDAECEWPGKPSCDTTAGLCVPCSGGPGTCGTGNPPLPDAKYVFVTSKTFDGNLGGLDGADAKCQQLAAAAKRPLPGTYRAWLSINDTFSGGTKSSPLYRFPHGDVPYVRTDGTVIAKNWDALVSGRLEATIHWDENGNALELAPYNTGVWTNTNSSGAAYRDSQIMSDCRGWKSNEAPGPTGSYPTVRGWSSTYTEKDYDWTQGVENSCAVSLRLYCFRQ
ncbi:hypothetical protein LVJ94_26560 [Pendulispora rubella]|uniref:DUF1554 domain-containing protein n=1 Tax=Pendulispora rubella TaxID=2741070 RepID=A0ABZ2KP84_9BACT